MQKLDGTKIKIGYRNSQNIAGPVASKKRGSFFGFFSSSKAGTLEKKGATALKEPELKSSPLNVPSVNRAAVESWVALEEKIVHDYKEQKTAQVKSAAPLFKTPAKPSQPAFETFSTQTAVSLPPAAPKPKEPLRLPEKTFSKFGKYLPIAIGLVAGIFTFLYIQGTFSYREVSQRLVQAQSEKEQLDLSYAELKNVSEDQLVEMEWLNGQLQAVNLELRELRAEKAASEQSLEKRYREALTRVSNRYEAALADLRAKMQTQDSILKALKAQSQAFEKIIDQTGMSALSGAAAGLSQDSFSAGGQGRVTSVNGRQGSITINLGSIQGAHSGSWITVSRSGIGFAVGRIDRVYPTMSIAFLRDSNMLQVIEPGDTVSFS